MASFSPSGAKTIFGHLTICRICNKEFARKADWVYKRGETKNMKYFCRYNCMRVWDKMSKKEKRVLTTSNA